MPQDARAAPEDETIYEGRSPFRIPVPPKPYSIPLEILRKTSDEKLMKLLTREIGPTDVPLGDGTKMAVTMEIMRRQAKRAERPTWWEAPYFWLAALVTLFAGAAAYPVLTADPQSPPRPQACAATFCASAPIAASDRSSVAMAWRSAQRAKCVLCERA